MTDLTIAVSSNEKDLPISSLIPSAFPYRSS